MPRQGVLKATLVGNIIIVKLLSHGFIYYLIITIILKFYLCCCQFCTFIFGFHKNSIGSSICMDMLVEVENLMIVLDVSCHRRYSHKVLVKSNGLYMMFVYFVLQMDKMFRKTQSLTDFNTCLFWFFCHPMQDPFSVIGKMA